MRALNGLIVAFHNSVVSVNEFIFHELNISVVSVVNDETIFQVILIISAVNVVNYEIIFNAVLEVNVVCESMITIFEHALLEMYFSRILENQRSHS